MVYILCRYLNLGCMNLYSFSALPLVSYDRFLLASNQNVFSDELDCKELTLGSTGVSGRRIFFWPVNKLPSGGTYPKIGVIDTCRR